MAARLRQLLPFGSGCAAPGMQIRFDDLRPGHRRSFGFVDPVEVLTADSVKAVAEVVSAAEGQAAAGRWVAGFLSYGAAPGSDPVLVTHPPAGGPRLAWFAVFEDRLVDPPWPEPLPFALGEWEPDTDRAGHREALDSIYRSIGAGDTYQVNYTMRLRSHFTGDAMSAYRALVRVGVGSTTSVDCRPRPSTSASPVRATSGPLSPKSVVTRISGCAFSLAGTAR